MELKRLMSLLGVLRGRLLGLLRVLLLRVFQTFVVCALLGCVIRPRLLGWLGLLQHRWRDSLLLLLEGSWHCCLLQRSLSNWSWELKYSGRSLAVHRLKREQRIVALEVGHYALVGC
jgi:hypothetical protein